MNWEIAVKIRLEKTFAVWYGVISGWRGKKIRKKDL